MVNHRRLAEIFHYNLRRVLMGFQNHSPDCSGKHALLAMRSPHPWGSSRPSWLVPAVRPECQTSSLQVFKQSCPIFLPEQKTTFRQKTKTFSAFARRQADRNQVQRMQSANPTFCSRGVPSLAGTSFSKITLLAKAPRRHLHQFDLQFSALSSRGHLLF